MQLKMLQQAAGKRKVAGNRSSLKSLKKRSKDSSWFMPAGMATQQQQQQQLQQQQRQQQQTQKS